MLKEISYSPDFLFHFFSYREKDVANQQERQFCLCENCLLQLQAIITSLLKHLHSCGTAETLIFFKLHTRYKYCIE